MHRFLLFLSVIFVFSSCLKRDKLVEVNDIVLRDEFVAAADSELGAPYDSLLDAQQIVPVDLTLFQILESDEVLGRLDFPFSETENFDYYLYRLTFEVGGSNYERLDAVMEQNRKKELLAISTNINSTNQAFAPLEEVYYYVYLGVPKDYSGYDIISKISHEANTILSVVSSTDYVYHLQ